MYFTENRYDRSIESMMKGIPNFYPRGSGVVVTGKFEYTADMCDCRLCEHYGGKLKACNVPRCVCLEERIAVGVALLTACSVTMDAVKAAEIGDSDVDLSNYGEYISNDELGELVSYGGYISKKEYSAMLSDNSVGASYYPSFAFCYDANGNVITVRRSMIGQYVGESVLMITVNGSRAYCIQPGAALNTGSSLTQTTSSGVCRGFVEYHRQKR